MDADRPYRTELICDVRDRVRDMGQVHAILVGGDIAYRGLKEEYDAALIWLSELADAAGCTLDDVFVVPGNHDVNQDVIKREPSVRNAQHAVSSAKYEHRERELREQFRDAQTGPALLAPLASFNAFAARFNCQVFAPERLFWRQERSLSPDFTLRLHGLTSTLLSGAGAYKNQPDTRLTLYLSPLQTAFDSADGIVNLVLCHHPPDWFMDQDQVEDAISGRAILHLFGHKHRQRIVRTSTYVRLAAGAVNPDRYEGEWEPGYNLVNLEIVERDGATFLDVDAHLLTWQTNPDCFRPKLNEIRATTFPQRIRLRSVPKASAPIGSSTAGGVISTPAPPGNTISGTSARDREVAMSEPQTRNLVFRFWNLSSSQRREIALQLSLITDDDLKLPEPERYGRALVRASEQGLLHMVAAAVHRIEKGSDV